ncbi:Ankyrin repeat domain-containing protein 50 [Colletotrichum siamense]|uniref:Ankyrin repeat domain-containing protein 50 n=1 Tax=Colletotrichum siamense TaxID=690259 RepID=UPI00187291F6|nr:Ankyrin repeat domain-containing protein 50 [Colletotrichum siamense]KAF5489252.1 Ankyrin repeat domain-containing protein 50 [Colletotrichum siamense]
MPMIYGEGEQAFRRLQEEIMRRNTDNSILAWNLSSSDDGPGEATTGKIHFGGVLAANPAEFANSGDIVCREQAGTAVGPSYVFGGHLRVHLCLYITATNQTFGLLNCHPKDDAESVVGIPLFGVSSDGPTEEYIRPDGHPGKLLRGVGTKGPSKLVRIYNDRQNQKVTSLNRRYGFYVEDSVHDTGLELVDVEPRDRWERDNATINTTVDFKHDQVQKTWVRFRQKREECRDYVAMLELEVNHSIHPRVHARCHIMTSSRDTDLKIIASKFGSMTKNTFGRQSASNGISNILFTLNEERIGAHQMFVLRLSFLSKPPTDSVDVTLALAQADRKASLRDLLFEDISIGSQRSSIGRQIREKEDGIQLYKEQLAEIQTQLSQLQVQKMMLDEGLTEATREFKHLDEQDGKLKKYQQALSQDVKATQDLLHTETTSQWHESLTRTLLFGLLPRSDAFANISLAEMSRKALVEATVSGCEVVIQFLLDGGFDFESKDDQDNSMLSIAASKGHEEVIQMFADKGANIESVNCQGVTPLLAATLQGNTSAAKLLLDLGSSIEAKIKDVQLSMNLESLVHQEHGGLAVADAQSHCGVGWTPLLVAVAKGNRNLTSLLVTRGADPETITSSGKTPLTIAAMKGDDVLTTYLLDRGADIKTRDANGWTPLFHATSRNNNPLMRLLIDKGANIQAEDTKGQSLLNLAAEKGHNSASALLKDSGSIETVANGDKASSQQDLHWKPWFGQTEVLA